MSTDRDIEKNYSLPDFIAELRRLADALESGAPFEIEIDGERVAVPGNAVVSVEHEREDGSEELEFQLSWESSETEGDDEGEDALEEEEDGAVA